MLDRSGINLSQRVRLRRYGPKEVELESGGVEAEVSGLSCLALVDDIPAKPATFFGFASLTSRTVSRLSVCEDSGLANDSSKILVRGDFRSG